MSDERLSLVNDQEQLRLRTALRESEILRELAELLASSLDLDAILQVLVKRTTEVCEIERCAVWLLEDARGILQPTTYHLSTHHVNNLDIETSEFLWYHSFLPFDDPVVHRLLKENGMLAIEDLRAEPSMRKVAETFLVRSVLLVALVREGRPVGMMSLDTPGHTRTFPPELQRLVRAIGQQAATAIDNARLYEQAQAERRRAEQLIERARSIYQVALAVNADEDLATILGIATQHLVRGLEADGGAIFLLETETLRLASTTQIEQHTPDQQTTVALADLPNCRHAATTGTPLFVTAEQAEGSEIVWYRKLGLENAMLIPLMVGTTHSEGSTPAGQTQFQLPHVSLESKVQHCVGLALVNYTQPNYRPSKGQFAFARDIAAQCALAIEKAHLLADARQAAVLANEHANMLDTIFQTMTEGISVLDTNGQVLLRNNAAVTFLGETTTSNQLANLLRRHPTYTIHGQPISIEDFPLTRALRGEHIRGERFRVRRVDSAERIIEVNVEPLLNSAQKRMGVVSAFRDVTAQVHVEQRLRQALETMLHVSEALSGITNIKDILHNVLKMTLTTLNCERGIVQLYDEEQQIFTYLTSIGLTQEAEKQWLSEQCAWLTPDVHQYRGFRTQLMEGHATLVNAEQCPHQPNSFRYLVVLAAPIMHNNRLLGLISLDRSHVPSHDATTTITDQSQGRSTTYEFSVWDMVVIEGIAQLAGLVMEQTRWQQEAIEAHTREAAMRQANALKDEFLSITAHEFRTPLTVILAHSQLAMRTLRRASDAELAPLLRDNLATIEGQTRLLSNIVQTFLEVTQINRGQLMLKLAEVDLAEIAQQVVADHSATSAEHHILCLIESDGYPYLVHGDRSRLLQVLANLVQNAIKYSPLGGPITVSLRSYTLHEDRASIEVCVADQGMGVPTDAQERLFESFYRAPNAQSSAKGIGLGLYIVAQLLHMHGGSIHVESSGVLGEGSRFIFTIPRLEKDRDTRV